MGWGGPHIKNQGTFKSFLSLTIFVTYCFLRFSDLDDPLGKAKYMAEKFTSVVETWPGTKRKIEVTEEGKMEVGNPIVLFKLQIYSKTFYYILVKGESGFP